MTYPEAEAYFDSLAQHGWKLDLRRIERLCELAGHPERAFPSVLVGGSAGKGSTCALLAGIFRAAGLRVGAAPKPHLTTIRERAQVDGEPVSEARFAALTARIQPLVEQVAREEGAPTLFEAMTLLAFLHFAEERVDRAVVEVGLGGRFDATNVLPAELSVITMIGLDHTDRLGETLAEIAFEKAGIVKPGGRVVTGASEAGGALAVIEATVRERGAALRRLGREIRLERVRVARDGTLFDLETPEARFRDLRIGLVGEHQARNAALAAAAALWLQDRHPLDETALRAGLAAATIPGRLQVLRREPLLLVDGAHSVDRAEALARAVEQLYLPERPGRRLLLVIGGTAGHDPETVVGRLAALAERVFATRSRHPQALPAADIAAAARHAGRPAEAIEPVAEAVRCALQAARSEDLVLVTGSLFVVAEALAAAGA